MFHTQLCGCGPKPAGYEKGMVIEMINFEEELKKFHPSLEIEEAEDAIMNHNLTDLTDILVEMVKEEEAKKDKE